MKRKIAYIHIGPAPIHLLGDIIVQLKEQNWTKDDILFAGHTAAPPSIALPGAVSNPIPLYFLLFHKEFREGDTPVPPTLHEPKPEDGETLKVKIVKG